MAQNVLKYRVDAILAAFTPNRLVPRGPENGLSVKRGDRKYRFPVVENVEKRVCYHLAHSLCQLDVLAMRALRAVLANYISGYFI